MKFYKEKNDCNFWSKILDNKLSSIYFNTFFITFYKNGKRNNNKNAAYIENNGYKEFLLNDKYYGDETNFTKQSWRKFVKLQTFL